MFAALKNRVSSLAERVKVETRLAKGMAMQLNELDRDLDRSLSKSVGVGAVLGAAAVALIEYVA